MTNELKDYIEWYLEAKKVLSILHDADRQDDVRTKLLQTITPETAQSMRNVVLNAEDMGIHLLIKNKVSN